MTSPVGSNVSIDGTLQASEWSDATHLSFNWAWTNSSLTGGGNVWVKNNGTNLLIAVSANGKTNQTLANNQYSYGIYLLFNDNNNGAVNNNDDAKSLTMFTSSTITAWSYQDLHYNSTQGRYVLDTYTNGTSVGSFSNPNGAGIWVWEFSMRMTSIYPEDFTLPVNGTIGFTIVYRETHVVLDRQVSSGWSYWEVYYSSGLPTGSSPTAFGWATIDRTNSQLPITDNTPPIIGAPTIQPVSPGPSDTVAVSVVVQDPDSGVKNVSIVYTTDNWKTVNKTLVATYILSTQTATAQIPALQSGGQVVYYIVAFDNAGNRGVANNAATYYTYIVPVPWYLNSWSYIAIAVALGAFLIAILFLTRRKREQPTPRTLSSPVGS